MIPNQAAWRHFYLGASHPSKQGARELLALQAGWLSWNREHMDPRGMVAAVRHMKDRH